MGQLEINSNEILIWNHSNPAWAPPPTWDFSLGFPKDLALLAMGRFPKSLIPPKLCVFDFDSTLTPFEGIDEIARECGQFQKVSEITERAMRGELDFEGAFRQRLNLLGGLDQSQLKLVQQRITPRPGLEAFLTLIQKKSPHIRFRIVSGGFSVFVDPLAKLLGFDEAVSHEIEIENGKLTGKIKNKLITAHTKQSLTQEWKKNLQTDAQTTWVFGDGANDLLMLSEGLSFSIQGKPAVQKQTQVHLYSGNFFHLTQLLQEHPSWK